MKKLSKLVALLGERSFRSALLRHRVAAAVEHQPVLRRLDCATVVDIGANRGQFTLVARTCFPQAGIFAMEPLAKPARRFRRVMSNDAHVMLHESAVGPHSGAVTMHVSRREDSSSLLPIGRRQSTLFPGTGERTTTVVRMAPLSDFVRAEEIVRPALLKLDVQGFELEALRGCEDLLACFDYVLAECSYVELYCGQALIDEVIAWFDRHDFVPRLRGNVVCDRDGRPIQADILFARVHHSDQTTP